MFLNFILDHIPVWAWVTMFALVAGVVWFYASPILLPIWAITPKWLKWVIGSTGVIFLALMGGRYKGRKDAEEEQRVRDAQAIQKRTEVDHDVGNLSTKDTHDQLSRWNRTDDQ